MWWSLYNQMLDEYPLPTEMATSAVLWFFGDIMAQKLEGRRENNNNHHADSDINIITTTSTTCTTSTTSTLSSTTTVITHNNNNNNTNNINTNLDWHRVGIQTIYAGFIWGIAGHYWYHWLDEQILIISNFNNNNNNKTIFVLSKLILEMILLHPISLLIFFVCVGLLNGETLTKISLQLRADFYKTLCMEYTLWTPIDVMNFAFIPVQHQLLVVNIACLFESVMLSYIKHHGTASNEVEVEGGGGGGGGGGGSIISSFSSIFFKNNNNEKTQKKKNKEEEGEWSRSRSSSKKKTITRTNIKEE